MSLARLFLYVHLGITCRFIDIINESSIQSTRSTHDQCNDKIKLNLMVVMVLVVEQNNQPTNEPNYTAITSV